MKDVTEKFYENYLLGAIRYKGGYNIYLMPIAWWILNHYKYDPDYDPTKWEAVFRDNVLNVTDDRIEDFIKAIECDKLSMEDLKPALQVVPSDYTYFYFFIDLDNKKFVSCFPDIEVENYLPDSSWEGVFGNPIEHIPDELKKVLLQDS